MSRCHIELHEIWLYIATASLNTKKHTLITLHLVGIRLLYICGEFISFKVRTALLANQGLVVTREQMGHLEI